MCIFLCRVFVLLGLRLFVKVDGSDSSSVSIVRGRC